MTFEETLAQVRELLRSKGRVSYRALKLQFNLDDDFLEGLKDELIEAEHLATDEGGKVLVWLGAAPVPSSEFRVPNPLQPPAPNTQPLTPSPQFPAERRQLTVMFCDLVGSTALSEQLDPEELRDVVRAYQETCTSVIRRYDGHVAQHLDDGLLVYFGYPQAHEDDAQRAVRTGLEIVAALQRLSPSPWKGFAHKLGLLHNILGSDSTPTNTVVATSDFLGKAPWKGEGWGEGSLQTLSTHSPHPHPLPKGARGLHVRIGVHTGLVVIGEIGSSEKREILALGETPNLAARVQGLAEPDTVVLSAATQRLVTGLFACQDLGPRMLKGISTPVSVYQVLRVSAAQSRFEAAMGAGLTPLIGREHEVGLFQERWERAKQGEGQVVLLSGEPGIGKSRLVQALKEQIGQTGATRIAFRCSPYHQNSAFSPIIEHLQRLLQFTREETPHAKLTKLRQALSRYRFPQADTLPLFAALLSLPHPEGAPPLTLSPQKQKQKTQDALVAWMVEEAEQAAVYCVWEDLHWVDPSTLEVLTLFLAQIPTARILTVLTFRPDFAPPWSSRSYLTQFTLSRLGRKHVETMVEHVTGGKALPSEVLRQIVTKTDGVPLFVEELTKTVLESIESIGAIESIGSAIPATLQDSLMARLDRLGAAKEVAQMGATLGREFSYELFLAVSPLDEALLQQGLRRLVEAELLYQRGVLPQATYLFKHALIQDTAYQSLLKSKRQQLHQQIAQVLAERFAEIVDIQPELLAHHYTEAGLLTQAIPYWQQAGQGAVERSANIEASSHLTKGLELLQTLPDTPECTQQELKLQIALAVPLIATKGYAAPEVEHAYTRARQLCQQLGETPQLFPVLEGLRAFYFVRAEYTPARELGEQLLTLAQRVRDPALLLEAHQALGVTLTFLGEFVPAREHLEQGIALYDPRQHRSLAFLHGLDPGVGCRTHVAWALWFLGYPGQAVKRNNEALTLAQELSHAYSLVYALGSGAWVYQLRREGQAAHGLTEPTMSLCREQGFPQDLAQGTILQGWVLAEQGQREDGITLMRQGLTAYRATGAEALVSYFLAVLAEAHEKAGQAEAGLTVLAEALDGVHRTGERWYEAELYRLKGELTLQSKVESEKSKEEEAEVCFLKAIEISRRQQAKSLELRATTSLARLWQRQGKLHEARNTLSEIYNWFTEGFDTKDLQEAKALLQELP